MATDNKTAKQIVSTIKKSLNEQKKNGANVPQVKIEHCKTAIDGYTCDVFIGDDEWRELSRSTMCTIIDALKEVKGLTLEDYEEVYLGKHNWWASADFKFPTRIVKYGKPCKEFNQLVKLVAKKYGTTLGIDRLYQVRLFGKSGRYGEYGNRRYVAYNADTCQRYIDLIKSFGRKKTTCKIVTDDDIDTRYMEEYLTEGDGYRTVRLKIERA